MSCNYCATQAAPVVAMSGDQTQATFSRDVQDTPRCPQCGAWYQPDAGCLVCEERLSKAITRVDNELATGSANLNDALVPRHEDLLSNEFMEQLYSNKVTISSGHKVQVTLRNSGNVEFYTDLQGQIVAHAYPLGKDAPPIHNILVTEAGINHEQWHDEITPMEMWYNLVSVSDTRKRSGPLNFDMAGQRVYEAWGDGKRGRPPGDGEYVIQVDRVRPLVSQLCNVIEDGRIERWGSRHYPGAGEVLAASCRLEERWDQSRIDKDSPFGQLFGAMLYTSLPYYEVKPEIEQRMHPKAREVLNQVRPIIMRAVNGTPDDVYQATLIVASIIERSGILPQGGEKPKNAKTTPPAGGTSSDDSGQPSSTGSTSSEGGDQPPPSKSPEELPGYTEQEPSEQKEDESTGGGQPGGAGEEDESGSGGQSGGAGEDDESGSGGQSGGAGEEDESGSGDQPGGAGEDDESSGDRESSDDGDENSSSSGNQAGSRGGSGSGGMVDEFKPISDDLFEAIAERTSREAEGAIKRGIEEKYGDRALAATLHRPLTGTAETRFYTYRDAQGEIKSALVQTPEYEGMRGWVQRIANDRKSNARQLAKYLRAVRSEVERTLTNQTQGKLDRRRFVPAVKGQRNVRKQDEQTVDTSLAVSVNLDISMSMDDHMQSGALLRSFLDIGQALEMLGEDVQYEGRAFSSKQTTVLLKSMGDKEFDPGRAAALADLDLTGGTYGSKTLGLAATSLRGAPSSNRLMVVLTDGGFSDTDRVKEEIEKAQGGGMVVFGIYLGGFIDDDDAMEYYNNKMKELYGAGNYAVIGDLDDMPRQVGQRIARIFSKLRVR